MNVSMATRANAPPIASATPIQRMRFFWISMARRLALLACSAATTACSKPFLTRDLGGQNLHYQLCLARRWSHFSQDCFHLFICFKRFF
jgi:hypothetical protein